MADILAYVTSFFNWLFIGTTGADATPAAITQVVNLVVGTPYLMIGLSLMIAGSAIGFLSRLIRNT